MNWQWRPSSATAYISTLYPAPLLCSFLQSLPPFPSAAALSEPWPSHALYAPLPFIAPAFVFLHGSALNALRDSRLVAFLPVPSAARCKQALTWHSEYTLRSSCLRKATPFLVRAMEESFVPLRGIKDDLHGRLACYKQDWTGGFRAGIRYELNLKANLIFLRNLALCCSGLVIRYHHGAKIVKLVATEIENPSPVLVVLKFVLAWLKILIFGVFQDPGADHLHILRVRDTGDIVRGAIGEEHW